MIQQPIADPSPVSADGFAIVPHDVHARLSRIILGAAALEAFFKAVEAVDVQELEYVPFQRFHLANSLARCVGDDLPRHINDMVRSRATGGFVTGLDGIRNDPDSFVKFGTAIGYLIGPANHDAMSGNYYARFLVKDTDDSDSYLRQAYRLFTLHTDGTFVDEATDWLLMMKFAEVNSVGGESRLLHIDDWAERDHFAHHPLGRHPFLYRAPGSKNVSTSVERPLFFESDHGLSISFIDQFADPRTMEEALFLRALSASMEASPGTVEMPLAVGELVVLNNYVWLHGRAPFQKHPHLHRELMRQRGTFAA